jgi:taurine transport system permease protein
LLKAWSLYARLTARWPAIQSIVPFVPLIAVWAVVAEAGLFPRPFFPSPMDVVRSFGALVYKGILPDYLEGSIVRLAVGAATGVAIGIPLGVLVGPSSRAHAALWPILLFFQAIGDIAWLPILLIWFGFGLTTMTRDHRRHERNRLPHVRCAPRRLRGRNCARHDSAGLALVHCAPPSFVGFGNLSRIE